MNKRCPKCHKILFNDNGERLYCEQHGTCYLRLGYLWIFVKTEENSGEDKNDKS